MFVFLIILYQLLFSLDGKLHMVKTAKRAYLVNTGEQKHHNFPIFKHGRSVRGYNLKVKPGRIGQGLYDLKSKHEFGGDYADAGVNGLEDGNTCHSLKRCEEGDGSCGEHSHCDRDQGVCVCNSQKQDYPNCCYPSCR